MLTWRLWRALRNPEEDNRLFERVQDQPVDVPGKEFLRPFAPLGRLLAVVIPALVVVIAPAALFLAANVIGALVAFNIMSTIQRERDQGTYDLLALTPMGLGRANWLIAEGCTQRINAIERLAQFRTLAIITLVLIIFYVLRFGSLTALITIAVIIAFNLDAIQSLIVGCLCGMLAQEFSEQGAPFAALAIFAGVQVLAAYLPVTAIAILLFDLLRRSLDNFLLADAIVALIVLILLFLLREALIRILWRELERRLL